MAAYALCNMKTKGVKLRGVGLVWAWLAAAGALFTVITIVLSVASAGIRFPGMRQLPGITRPYAFQLISGLGGLVGYLLLLCKKRAGLYVILLGVGLPLGAQLMGGIDGLSAGVWSMLLTTLLGGLNPLFAWLAVRAGKELA